MVESTERLSDTQVSVTFSSKAEADKFLELVEGADDNGFLDLVTEAADGDD